MNAISPFMGYICNRNGDGDKMLLFHEYVFAEDQEQLKTD